MIEILLMLPAYAKSQDVKQTYECIKKAGFPENETIILLYSDLDIADMDVPAYTLCFTKENRSNMFKFLSISKPDDIIIPLFAGDNFASDILSEAIQEMDNVDYITIRNQTKDAARNLMSSYIYAMKFSAINTTTFYKCFDQSCTCVADSLVTHVKKEAQSKTVYVDGAINTLFVDSNFENLQNIDKRNVWAFCSGQYSNDFRGNPKYLFLYLNKYRPDITTYWLCDSEAIISQVKHFGMTAYQLGSVEAFGPSISIRIS